MTILEQMQTDVDGWVQQFKPAYWPPKWVYAQLTEEIAEVGTALNNLYGPRTKKKKEPDRELGAELCDVLFACCCFADSHNISLDDAIGSPHSSTADEPLDIWIEMDIAKSHVGENIMAGQPNAAAKYLGHIILYCVSLAGLHHINLPDAWKHKMEKKQRGRDKDRYVKKAGAGSD